MSVKSGIASQVLPLPTGGGGLRSIGETFAPDLFTGTGNLTVPIELPPGRNGFQPTLRLGYSTGFGNGPFGLGWQLSVPGVTRKTSRGVPRYDDSAAAAEQRDTFILSGTEDLVPVAQAGAITRFRPRTEGLFARIERDRSPGSDFWRIHGRDGLVSRYGTPEAAEHDQAAIVDPARPTRVFEWRLSETADPFGNRIVYEYRRNASQLYLERIRYVEHERNGEPAFLVSVSFDYQERPDKFSDCRAGFEIQTRLRCRRIEVRTHADADLLARTYELTYTDEVGAAPPNGVSLLHRIEVVGHDGDARQSLAPVEFGYSGFAPDRATVGSLTAPAGAMPGVSLASPDLDLVDLFGRGLPDLVQVNGVAQFWRNLGSGMFAAPEAMPEVPAVVRLADPGVQLADLNGDGRTDLLAQDLGGYFPLGFEGRWRPEGFVRYDHLPSVALDGADVRLMDLDGDGIVDALRTGAQQGFELFFNSRTAGWDRVETRPPLPEFSELSLADPRVKLGDLNGDGLADLVLVEAGQVRYWPYLGHGQWGPRVTMDPAPAGLPPPGVDFDPRRVLLGDVDGDGLDDLVYVEPRRATVWLNQSGRGWGEPISIADAPLAADLDGIRVADMLGNGAAGVVWSSDAPEPGTTAYRFLDLTAGVKPYVLDTVDNHMGVVTRIRCVPSTTFYLADAERSATQWRTPLPFPVQVVEQVEVIDEHSRGKLTTRYSYHHGYWDGADRELRGFGRVEQLDTEVFEAFNGPGLRGDAQAFDPISARDFSPPLLAKTWFHLGPIGEEFGDRPEADFSAEYWAGDDSVLPRPAGTGELLEDLHTSERADAIRSLRGQPLRMELYALDGSERADRPFTVTESQYGIREESPPAQGEEQRRCIFFPHVDAQRTTDWDRGTDPMTQFVFTDDYDNFGQARRAVTIAVPRGRDFRRPAESADPYLGTITTTTFAQRDDGRYIGDRLASTTSHQLLDGGAHGVFGLRDAVVAGTAERALLAHSLTYYDGPAFEGLPLGRLGDFAAPVRSEALVLTEGILAEAFGDGAGVPPYLAPSGDPAWTEEYPPGLREQMPVLAGYTFSAGDAERPRGYYVQRFRHRYDLHTDPSKARGLLLGVRDALGHDASLSYDAFGLLPVQVRDAVGLTNEAAYDYRILQPRLVTDENGNRSAFAFTPLGLLDRVAVMGKVGESVGDTLAAPGTRFAYDLAPAAGQPVSVRTIRRIRHVTDPPAAGQDETIETVEYSDGFGRLLQARSQAEGAIFGDAIFGGGVLPTGQDDPATEALVAGRVGHPDLPTVVVSGSQVTDNKGRIVEKFEPFFAAGWDYTPPAGAQLGQKITMSYDARGRLVRTVHPDGSQERVVHGIPTALDDPDRFEPTPWETYTYDRNDNAGRTHPTEAAGYAHHWNTPGSTVVDPLGRAVLKTARTRADAEPIEELTTHCAYDIRGRLLAVTDPLGRQAVRNVFDLTGRALRSESIDAGTQRVVYDAGGSERERRDGRGALTLRAYDVLGRPSRLWARDHAADPVGLRERVEYGDDGDPDQPAADRAAARTVNRLGALHRHYDEAGLVTVLGYDLKGGALERTRQAIADDAILAAFPAREDPTPDWHVTAFRVDWQPPDGDTFDAHAAQMLEPAGYPTSIRYDALHRIESLRCPPGTNGVRRELGIGYTPSGAIRRITLDGEPVVERIAYDARGQRTLTALGNGILTRFAYDPKTMRLQRLRSERYTKPAGGELTYRPGGTPVQDLAYRYDVVGNVIEILERTGGSGVRANPEAGGIEDAVLRGLVLDGDALVRRFTHDPLYRLASASGRECLAETSPDAWTDPPRCGFNSGGHGLPNQDNAAQLTGVYREEFSYDAAGNLGRLRHVAQGSTRSREFQIAEGSNRLRAMTSGQVETAYTHDAAGNLTGETGSRHFEWDHSSRMTSFRTQVGDEEPSVHAHYLYGAAGERVKKLVRRQGGGVEVTTYIDGIFEHHRAGVVTAPTFGTTSVLVADADRRVLVAREGVPHPDDRGPDMCYLLGDHLGSSSLTVDAAGSFVNREEFTAYGETTFGSFARKRYRYMGRERDEESGLSHHGHRYYAPWLARWRSTDPAGAVDGWNLYAFCRLNPLRFVDLEGTDAKEKAIRDYSNELQNSSYLKGEINRLDNIMASRIRAQEKAYAALAALDTSGLSERAVDREIDRLTEIINRATQEFNEAKAALPGVKAQLERSSRRIADLTKRMYKLGIDVDKMETELKAMKKSRGGVAGAGAAAGGGSGKAVKGLKLLGKAVKITTVIEAGVAGGKVVKHVANGDFGAAAGVVKDFAYDQTVGFAKGVYDLGKSAISGIGDAIFGPSDPKPPTRPNRNRLRDFAQGMMLLTYVVGLAAEASQTPSTSEPSPSGESSGVGGSAMQPFEHPFMQYPGVWGPLPIGPPIWLWGGAR